MPAPSATSSTSSSVTNSTNRLPYSVTPPKAAGPSEAERKIEALTKQIEEQMEKEEESEYFGKAPFALYCMWHAS